MLLSAGIQHKGEQGDTGKKSSLFHTCSFNAKDKYIHFKNPLFAVLTKFDKAEIRRKSEVRSRQTEDRETARLQDRKTARLQDRKTARPQDCKTARLQDRKTARLQDCKTARLQDCKTDRLIWNSSLSI